MNERQQKYLDALRQHGSAPRARQAAGVTRRTVSNWEQQEDFAEAAAEALEAANDAILQRAREQAMSGDSKLLSTWMKALIPALRPASSVNVAVGVKTGNAERRLAEMDDEQLLAAGARIVADAQLRAILPAGAVIDADPVPASLPAPEAPVGPENGPDEYIDPESIL